MERSTEDTAGGGIQVIARAADILRALRSAPEGLSQAEVADRLLHCTANGKAFLASMSPQDLSRATSGNLARLTEHTITEPAALHQELQRVRAEGIAYDREEHTEGICAVGTTIRGVAGVGVAVSIPLPAQRFYGRELLLHDALLGWAERVERELDGAGEQRAPSSRPKRPGQPGAITPPRAPRPDGG